MKSIKTAIPVFIFILSLAIYWFTANPYPSGYADSDELITTGHLFSVAHPPGYGLIVILVGTFQRLLFFLSPAYASNLLAGILHACTLVIVYKTAVLLLPKNHRQSHLYILAIGVITAGLSGLFWIYGSVIEVMSLGNLFVALTVFLAVSWANSSKPNTLKSLLTISMLLGIGIGHLQTLILLAPALLILYLVKTHPQNISITLIQVSIALIVTITGFLVSSATIIPLDARKQPFSWTFPQGINGWWHMVTRKDYSGAFLDRDSFVENPYTTGFDLQFIDKFPAYAAATWNHFAGLPAVLILLGGYYLYKKSSRPVFIYLTASYIVAGALFGTYVTLTEYDPTNLHFRLLVGTAERQYLMGHTLLLLFFALGLVQLVSSSKLKYLSAITLFAAVFVANYPLADQKNNSVVYQYNQLLLSNAEPDSVIICASDFACFGLYYQSLVEKMRPDVTVLSKNTKARVNFLKNGPQYIDYIYPENPNFTGHLTAYNTAIRPTYYSSISQFDIEYHGFDGNPFFAVPRGYLTEISKTKPGSMAAPVIDDIVRHLGSDRIDHRDFHLLGFKDYIASYYQVLARYMTKYGYSREAATALDYALYLNPNDPRVIDWRLRLNTLIQTFAYDDHVATSSAQYLVLAKRFQAENDLQQSEAFARKALYRDPQSLEALEFLQSLYRTHNYPLFETWTSEHLRKLKNN
jgi:hypothetical protein